MIERAAAPPVPVRETLMHFRTVVILLVLIVIVLFTILFNFADK